MTVAYMNNREDLSDRGALSSELAIDRGVLALDTLAQAQEFSVVAHPRDLQIGLPSSHVDNLFQLPVEDIVNIISVTFLHSE